MLIRLVATNDCNKFQSLALSPCNLSHGSFWLMCNSGKTVDVANSVSEKIVLRFPNEVVCSCVHANFSSTAVFCLKDGRIVLLSMDAVFNDLSRDPVSDAYNKTCGTEDDIFVSLLEPAHSKQESPLSVFAEPYCTTIACYDSSLSIATRIMMFGETMLLLVHSKNNSLICGYSSVLIPTGYSSSFVIGKDLVKEYISSFIVLCTNCGKVSNDSAAILISDYLVTSYFGLDVSLSKCKILLYGTCSTNGDIFYAVIPSTDHCFKEVNLKSCLLLSMNQPVIEVLAHTILCSNDTEVGANSLFFIGKEGKVCVLFSFKKSSDSKEFLLNIPVYSACVLKHYLLMSSYKEIMVINLECKGNNKEESFCISTLLVKAFCNPKILKIDSVTKMCVDTRRSSVLLAKRNGCVYALNESDLASKLLSPLGNNLQEVVTKLGEVSDKIDMLKKNLNTTDMCLKQLNGSIGLFLSVNLRDENNALFSCQLLPEIYDQKNGEISVKLDLKYSGSKPSADGWFLSIHMTSSNYTCGFSFYSLSDFTQDETFSHHIKLCTKHLAIKVTWSIYCHFTHEELSRSNKVAGICSVIKQERLNVLGFLKKLNSNTLQQHSLCNMEGHLTLSKQSWERTNFKNIFLCEADSDTANLHLANSFLIHKTNIAHVVHMHKINKGECVIGRFLTNSAAFVCELRAAFIENVKHLQDVSSSPPVSYNLIRSQLQSISGQLQHIGDQLITDQLDRDNCARQLFGIYLCLSKL